jgi:hypothetical protein
MSGKKGRDPDVERRSAVAIAHAILQMNDVNILSSHRKRLLNIALWKLTLADGHKWKTRYQSRAAQKAERTPDSLRHDHVYQRAAMVKDLLEAAGNPKEIDRILAQAVPCTVTKEEHDRLGKIKGLDGWARYRVAGIAIVDTETGNLLVLDVLIATPL